MPAGMGYSQWPKTLARFWWY